MLTYEFKLTLQGEGENEEEAWTNAVDAFIDDPGEPASTKIKGFRVWDEDDERIGHV